jgi:hypothetical protein
MKSCGKRLFTPACKAPPTADWRGGTGMKNRAVRRLPGRFFFAGGGGLFFPGFLRKAMFWCGVFVVKLW